MFVVCILDVYFTLMIILLLSASVGNLRKCWICV